MAFVRLGSEADIVLGVWIETLRLLSARSGRWPSNAVVFRQDRADALVQVIGRHGRGKLESAVRLKETAVI